MNKLLFVLLILILFTNGCIFRPAAKTLIFVNYADKKCPANSLMGLRETAWAEIEDKVTVIGYGWHPREHENYMFFISEPFPMYMPRHIRVTSEDSDKEDVKQCKVELLLESSLLPCDTNYDRIILYTATTSCKWHKQLGNVIMEFDELELSPVHGQSENIVLSGKIEAMKKSKKDFTLCLNRFDKAVFESENINDPAINHKIKARP